MAITEKTITICGHGSGTPRTTNLYSYNTTRYGQIASNGKHKCIVAVRRFKALTDEGRVKYHDTYKTILGRNLYNQDRRDYCYKQYKDGKYYSDCSSSICLTYSQIGYYAPALNTAGIYQSDLFEDVPVVITNGHVANPEILKVGDCLLYIGNDPKRPQQIGHVESVYEITDDGSGSSSNKSSLSNLSYQEIQIKSLGLKGIVTIANLNIRSLPSTQAPITGSLAKGQIIKPTKRTVVNNVGWFKIEEGWVSAKYCYGWIQDMNCRWWYLTEAQGYEWYKKTVATIDGKDYAFDKNGYLIESKNLDSSGAIIS